MNPVVHFEMPAEDKSRAAKFYTEAFGWKMQQLGAEMGDYLLATTCEMDVDRMPKRPGQINGGFFGKGTNGPMRGTSITLGVEDVKAAAEKVKAAGGQVHGEPVMIPNVGWYLLFTDTEGNVNSMLQPTNM